MLWLFSGIISEFEFPALDFAIKTEALRWIVVAIEMIVFGSFGWALSKWFVYGEKKDMNIKLIKVFSTFFATINLLALIFLPLPRLIFVMR